MEINEAFYAHQLGIGLTVEVQTPPSELQQEQEQEQEQQRRGEVIAIPQKTSLSLVEEINLVITFQIECNHFLVAEGRNTLIKRHKSPKLPFRNHCHPVQIFNHGNKALQQYLSSLFKTFGDTFDAEQAAKDIIEKWVEIRDKEEFFLCGFRSVFVIEVTVTFWKTVLLRETRRRRSDDNEDVKMIPASNLAIERMLKRKKMGDLESDEQICAICMEEMKRMIVFEMPCSHMFHSWCIKRWLRISHLCPNCRFPMPI